MSSLELGILTGLGAAVGFGVGDFFSARSSRQYNALHVSFWIQFLRVIITATLFIMLGWQLTITPLAIILTVLSGAVLLMGQVSAFQALKIGPVGLASPFISTYALVSATLSIILLHERLRPLQLLAVALLVAGAMLASVNDKTHRPHKDFWRQRTVLLALWGAFCIGVGLVILAFLIREVGWQGAMLLQGLSITLAGAVVMRITKTPFRPPNRAPISGFLLGAAAFSFLGALMIILGISSSLVAIVAPVASISPLFTVILALIFLKEKLSKYQLAGAFTIICGLVLLSVR